MDCNKNTYQDLSSIVESFANDQQYWSGEIYDLAWIFQSYTLITC